VTHGNGRAALWDLDGTILDSREVHWVSWRRYTERLGKPMSLGFFNDTFGFRNEIILRRHFGAGLSDEAAARMSDEKETLYRDLLVAGGIEALPGVLEWLAAFRDAGWQQALASMAPRNNIAVTLDALGIGGYFSVVVAAEDVRHGKPAPDVFLAAAETLGAAPGACIVIEDSPQGVAAAKSAGMKCIAVGPESVGLGADLALPSLAGTEPRVAWALLG
jgi:beta-phosphoglucomutase